VNGGGFGASGAIFGVFGGLMALAWLQRAALGATVFRRIRTDVIGVLLLNLAIAWFVPNIDHACHFGGLATGFLCGVILGLGAGPWTRISQVARTSCVAFVGCLAIAAAVLCLPSSSREDADFGLAFLHLADAEQWIRERYNSIKEQRDAQALTPADAAERIERECLEPWRTVRKQFDTHSSVPRDFQTAIPDWNLFMRFLDARHDALDLSCKAWRADQNFWLANQEMEMANQILAFMKSPKAWQTDSDDFANTAVQLATHSTIPTETELKSREHQMVNVEGRQFLIDKAPPDGTVQARFNETFKGVISWPAKVIAVQKGFGFDNLEVELAISGGMPKHVELSRKTSLFVLRRTDFRFGLPVAGVDQDRASLPKVGAPIAFTGTIHQVQCRYGVGPDAGKIAVYVSFENVRFAKAPAADRQPAR